MIFKLWWVITWSYKSSFIQKIKYTNKLQLGALLGRSYFVKIHIQLQLYAISVCRDYLFGKITGCYSCSQVLSKNLSRWWFRNCINKKYTKYSLVEHHLCIIKLHKIWLRIILCVRKKWLRFNEDHKYPSLIVLKILTCFETNCLISSSVVVKPFVLTTKATGTSPAFSSIMLKVYRKILAFSWFKWALKSFQVWFKHINI